ncbi:putrescine/spermidine ABC transporter permease [Methylopila jiangsuensis]|uniref:Putrescine/spermidine ABC transporter permease n=1 Tax=Methylopila jiangsuensis TaxID=586230 RepID=A0A9W6JH32_9HYPH|nr:ABC transporter permease subunit [Methylopila jiangsuensis]MDR6285953.1 putrescine transport system permease protein [Methylopila jiangsuensis]GLK75710.1 putrescine/spermidine ABC transporter permease [Methylopila jiangsuensis]
MADPKAPGANPLGRWAVIGTPYLWLLVFFLAPFFIVLKISLSDTTIAQPPYEPLLDLSLGWQGVVDWWSGLDFENYWLLTEDELYWFSYVSSLRIAAISTVLMLLIGYPMAYAMAKAPKGIRPALVMAVILPFWTSLLIRVYAWIGILSPEGLLNAFLLKIGLISEPLYIMNTETAVFIGIVYSYLPFMVLPLYASLEKLDHTLLEAASDLGSPPWKSFWQITVPLSLPGVVAGCFLVFIPAVGEFVIPDLLGGSETLMIGKTLYNEFFSNRDWPVSSAIAVLLLLVLVVPIALYQNVQSREVEAKK